MLVRGFAALLAYVVGLSAMIGVGAIGMIGITVATIRSARCGGIA
jgi:hypothetical protein